MVMLALFAVLALMVVCLVGPSRLIRWMRQRLRETNTEAVIPPAVDPIALRRAGPAPEEELMEQVLTAKRLAGILSLQDYQREMAALAERDAISHPMTVPPEAI